MPDEKKKFLDPDEKAALDSFREGKPVSNVVTVRINQDNLLGDDVEAPEDDSMHVAYDIAIRERDVTVEGEILDETMHPPTDTATTLAALGGAIVALITAEAVTPQARIRLAMEYCKDLVRHVMRNEAKHDCKSCSNPCKDDKVEGFVREELSEEQLKALAMSLATPWFKMPEG